MISCRRKGAIGLLVAAFWLGQLGNVDTREWEAPGELHDVLVELLDRLGALAFAGGSHADEILEEF